MSLNTMMARIHEAWAASLFGGRQAKGSGNQWHDQIDGRQDHMSQQYAVAWDCKATLGKGITITRAMWEKAVEQAGGEEPMLALRWYETQCLEDVGLDLTAVRAGYLARLIEAANGHA